MSPELADAVAKRNAYGVALRALVKAVEAERDADAYSRIGGRSAGPESFAVDEAIDRALIVMGEAPLYGTAKPEMF